MDIPRFRLKAAAVHAAPVYMDKEATTAKVVKIIESAGEKGIQLLAFPETFIPGYPVSNNSFLHTRHNVHDQQRQYFCEAYPPLTQVSALAQYAQQSVICNDTDASIQAIQKACRTAAITISLGVSERTAGGFTLYNSQVFIDDKGEILGVHRKLQPTYAERFVWGQGDGSTLRVWPVDVVVESTPGSSSSSNIKDGQKRKQSYNLGGLCCWENTLNGARQALIHQNQHVHVGAWPALSTMAGFEPVADSQIEALMKTHALTAQVFVLCAANYVDETCLAWMDKNLGPQGFVKRGGGWTAVIHPFCSFLGDGPVTGEGEKLVTAELDFASLGPVKVWIDGNGHYKRPEVLEMKVNQTPYTEGSE